MKADKNRLGLVAAIGVCLVMAMAAPLRAQQYLSPEDAVLSGSGGDEHEFLARSLFREAYQRDSTRMLVEVPFEPEFAVTLLKSKSGYQLIGLRSPVNLAQYWSDHVSREALWSSMRAPVSIEPLKAKVKRCRIAIESALGDKISSVWRKMLFRTQFSANRGFLVTHPTDFHFGSCKGTCFREPAGQTQLPYAQGAAAILIESGLSVCPGTSQWIA